MNVLHYKYWIGILLGIVVLIVTVKFGNNNGLVSYVGFAASLAGILISTIAIIHSITTNTSSQNSLSDLSAASRNMNDVYADIKVISKGISEALSVLPHHLETLHKKVDSGFANLDSGVKKAFAGAYSAETSKSAETDWSNLDVKKISRSYVNASSNVGFWTLMIARFSCEKSEKINLVTLHEEFSILNPEYMIGFAVSASSFGLVDIYVSMQEKSINCNDMLNELKDALDEAYPLRRDDARKKYDSETLKGFNLFIRRFEEVEPKALN